MLKTVVKKGSYQDSVVLMLLTNELLFTGWSQQDSGYDGYTGEQRHF